MKILIIEDEILIQRSLKKLLEVRKVEVDAVSSGKEGLKLLKEKTYDRIICDLMLQDISGFDILEEAKNELTPEIISEKFIIMTAYSSEQVINKAKSYQCKFIQKPFKDINAAINFFMD